MEKICNLSSEFYGIFKIFVVTDDESTLVQSAIEDSQIAKDELQSAIMLYNDGFPCGQETFLENGMYF